MANNDVQHLLDMLYEMIDGAKNAPLTSDKCILNRDEALDLLDEIRAQLPVELSRAQELIRAKEDYVKAAKRDVERMMQQAEQDAKNKVSETEVLGIAREKSREIIETLRKECLTYTELSTPVMMLNIESDAATNTYGCAFVTERDVQTLALIRKYIGVEPTSIDPENIGELQLDFYVGGEENVWVGVEVTDRNDIAALVKDAISVSEMQLYSDSTAQYGLTDHAENNVIYTARKAGSEAYALNDLAYPKNAFPTETVEKYRAAAEKLAQDPTSNAVTLDGDTMVTRTSLG